MQDKSATANEEEITSIQITGAICKILSPDIETSKACSELTEKALVGNISVDEQEKQSKKLIKYKNFIKEFTE